MKTIDYEEKLKEAKRLYETANKDQRYVLESIFPELKRSEDERIRKKLIEAVKGDMVVGGTKDKQRAIAWLEKQGEQKPVNFKAKDWYVSKVDGKIHNMTYNPTDKVEPKSNWSEEDE